MYKKSIECQPGLLKNQWLSAQYLHILREEEKTIISLGTTSTQEGKVKDICDKL